MNNEEKKLRELIKKDKVNWNNISKYKKLSEKFIREFKDKVDWNNISATHKLSEKFIKEFKDKVDWDCISSYQKLSEKFIRELKGKVSWDCISSYQKLSEKFIREFQDKVDWYNISETHKLSEKFIREFQDKVNWKIISECQKLSRNFIKEFNLTMREDCWRYKTKEEKLKYIKDNKLDKVYKLVGNKYIIAYKSTRLDGYSVFNFQYKYEVGKTYKSHCDCNIDNENSFGLSAWTKEKAIEYHKGSLYKVRINIEDIGCFVHNNGKIRAKKITILERCN